MRNKVGHYYNLTIDERVDIWNTGHIIFDTNVLLKLYLLTEDARIKFFTATDVLKERIWLPHHIAYEFATNRFIKMNESRKRYTDELDNVSKLFRGISSSLNLQDRNEELDKMQSALEQWLSNHQKVNLPFVDYSDDSLSSKIFELYEGKTGDAFTKQELDNLVIDGESRHNNATPPGYKDYEKIKEKTNTDKKLYSENNFLGDLIIWKQIINYSKTQNIDIIFVTEEKKEDWWYKISGEKIGARLELRREFADETSKHFLLYDMGSFLHQFNEYIEHQHPEVEQIPDSVLKEVAVVEERIAIEKSDGDDYYSYFNPITTEEFVEELNGALSYFNGFGGFLSSKHFIEKILASKNYDIGLCWEKAKELERNGTIELYTHEGGDGRFPLSAIRFKK